MNNRRIKDNIIVGNYGLEVEQTVLKREWKLIREMKPCKSSVKKPFKVGIVHHTNRYESLTPVANVPRHTIKTNHKRQLFPILGTNKNIISSTPVYKNDNFCLSPGVSSITTAPIIHNSEQRSSSNKTDATVYSTDSATSTEMLDANNVKDGLNDQLVQSSVEEHGYITTLSDGTNASLSISSDCTSGKHADQLQPSVESSNVNEDVEMLQKVSTTNEDYFKGFANDLRQIIDSIPSTWVENDSANELQEVSTTCEDHAEFVNRNGNMNELHEEVGTTCERDNNNIGTNESGKIEEVRSAPSDIEDEYENENEPNSPVFYEINISPQPLMRGTFADKNNVLNELQNMSDVGTYFTTEMNTPDCDIIKRTSKTEICTKKRNVHLRRSLRIRKRSQKLCCSICPE